MLENTHKNADAFNIESQDERESIGDQLDIHDGLLSPALSTPLFFIALPRPRPFCPMV